MSTESRKLEKKLDHLRDIKRRDAVREIYGGSLAPGGGRFRRNEGHRAIIN